MNNALLSERDFFLPAIIADRDSDVPRLIFADWLEEQQYVPCPYCCIPGRTPGRQVWVAFGVCEKCDGSGKIFSEYNSERAEFIRVQCELAKYPSQILSDVMASLNKTNSYYAGWDACREENPQWEKLQRRQNELFKNSGSKGWWDWILGSYRTTVNSYLGCQIATAEQWTYFLNRGFVNRVEISWKGWLEHWQAIRAACPLEEVRFTTSPQHNFDGFLDSENLINYVKFGNFGCIDLKITLPE